MIEVRNHIQAIFEAKNLNLTPSKHDSSVSSIKFCNHYFIENDSFEIEIEDNCIKESLSPVITLYIDNQKGLNKVFDESVALARDVLSSIAHPRNLTDGINRVRVNGFSVQKKEDSPDLLEIILNTEYEISYGLKE